MTRQHLLTVLAAYRPTDDQQLAFAAEIQEFVSSSENFFDRHNYFGHVTGSAWVIDADRQQTLLIHHRKLRRWLQLGGHVENDETILGAALREAHEESGLTGLRAATEEIFDLDIHRIPSSPKEPEHFHFDIRFAILADSRVECPANREGSAFRWFHWQQVLALPDPSLARLARKSYGAFRPNSKLPLALHHE